MKLFRIKLRHLAVTDGPPVYRAKVPCKFRELEQNTLKGEHRIKYCKFTELTSGK